MGQKTNPVGFRLGVNRTWDSLWFDEKNYATLLEQDLFVKKLLSDKLKHAGVANVKIERLSKRPRITVSSARPGVVIGKRGGDIEKLRLELCKRLASDVSFNVVEVRKPEVNAMLVAQNIAQQLEKRVSFRRAMRKAIQFALKMGAEGIRVNCSGRLGGAEIARMEWSREGRVPLHKLRADIDYGVATAKTTYGTCGVKVWIYLGDLKGKQMSRAMQQPKEAQGG
ncbi:MAG: 30S ribosomal protein S3 [Holosporaceae bacterium]